MEYTVGTKVFGDWEITAEIGEGSYGKVYQLRKESFGITANGALKVLRIPRSNSDIKDALSQGMDEQSVTGYFKGIVEEFMREVAVMSDMKSHPNIVGCQDYAIVPHEGSMGWDILIRMDLLTPLQSWQVSHNMNEEEVRRLGIDLCEALIHCQQRGLIHRDIKPANIFVDDLGRFRLGDFGVARTADKTMGGMSKQGTENYMAPEVYLGKPYGPTVDIYSLGMVLYQLMNGGRLPFYPLPPAPIEFSHRFEVLKKRMGGEQMPPPVHASEDFAAIILKACAFESSGRYRTAAELMEALKGRGAQQPKAAPTMDESVSFAPAGGFSFAPPAGDETIGPAFAPRTPAADATIGPAFAFTPPAPKADPQPVENPIPQAEPEKKIEPKAEPKVEPTEEKRPFDPVAILHEVLERHPAITPGKGIYHMDSFDALCATLGIPAGEVVYLCHDDSWFKRGKNGFALSERGIYTKPMGGDVVFMTWKQFANGKLTWEEKKLWECQLAGVSVYCCTSGDQEQKTLLAFYQDLNTTMKQMLHHK